MKILGARTVRFSIPFHGPLYVGSKVLRERHGCFLELHDEAGRRGVGEASPWPGASASDLHELENDLWKTCNALAQCPADFEAMLRLGEAARFGPARAAVEMALYDLEALSRGVRVVDLLGGARRTEIPVNALLCGEAASSAAAARQAGFSCIKLKADGRDMPRVCATLREVRDVVGAPMRIRIDLNSAWTVDEAIDWIPRLAAYGIEYIEQPVASVAELSRVRSVVDVPIAADECVTSEAAVRTIAAAGAADVIVVKPGWIGLTQAMGIARAAEECGLDVVVTSTLDTSIGISAALHVAAALPEPLRHCGLATAPLLAGDLVRDALVPVRGSLRLPDGSGLGVRVDTDAIARWRIDTGQAAAAL